MVYATNPIFEEHDDIVLSRHDVYWQKRDGSRVLVCRAGDLVSHAHLDRFKNIHQECRVDLERLNSIIEILAPLKNPMRAKEKMQVVQTLRDCWSDYFGHDQIALLEVVILSELLVPDMMKSNASLWSKASMSLFHRSCFVATMSLIGSCALGYSSWSFLSEIWRMSFALSSQYAEAGLDLSSLPKFELVRTQKTNEKPKLVVDTKADFKSLVEVTNLFFEQPDGNGFPRELNIAEMTDVERLYAHIQNNTPWEFDLSDDEWWGEFWSNDIFHVLKKLQGDQRANIKSKDEYLDFGL